MASLTLESPSPPIPLFSTTSTYTSITSIIVFKKKRKTTRSCPHCSRSRSPIKTKSCSNQVQHGPIRLSKETPPAYTSEAASDKQVERNFFTMLGWVLDDLNIEEIEIQEIISDDLAKLLACANTHCYSQKLREEDI